jgi:hypothetical protein
MVVLPLGLLPWSLTKFNRDLPIPTTLQLTPLPVVLAKVRT